MNYIAKILMNSLYGRFGMDDNFKHIEILSKKEFNKLQLNNFNVYDIIDLDNNYLIQLNSNNLDTILENGLETHNINIAIASAITSYARVFMNQFKNNPNYKLFYTDTDSIYINKPLNNSLISNNEIGKLKLEYIAGSF
jgi:hypothetical protein